MAAPASRLKGLANNHYIAQTSPNVIRNVNHNVPISIALKVAGIAAIILAASIITLLSLGGTIIIAGVTFSASSFSLAIYGTAAGVVGIAALVGPFFATVPTSIKDCKNLTELYTKVQKEGITEGDISACERIWNNARTTFVEKRQFVQDLEADSSANAQSARRLLGQVVFLPFFGDNRPPVEWHTDEELSAEYRKSALRGEGDIAAIVGKIRYFHATKPIGLAGIINNDNGRSPQVNTMPPHGGLPEGVYVSTKPENLEYGSIVFGFRQCIAWQFEQPVRSCPKDIYHPNIAHWFGLGENILVNEETVACIILYGENNTDPTAEACTALQLQVRSKGLNIPVISSADARKYLPDGEKCPSVRNHLGMPSFWKLK